MRRSGRKDQTSTVFGYLITHTNRMSHKWKNETIVNKWWAVLLGNFVAFLFTPFSLFAGKVKQVCLIYLESNWAHFALSSLSIAREEVQGERGGLIKWLLITRQWMLAFLFHFLLPAKSGVWFLIMRIADWASSWLPLKQKDLTSSPWRVCLTKCHIDPLCFIRGQCWWGH